MKVSLLCCPLIDEKVYFDAFFDDVLSPRDFLMRNTVLLFEVLQIEVRSDLAELSILVEQFADLSFVGGLIDFVGAVEFFDIVHEA